MTTNSKMASISVKTMFLTHLFILQKRKSCKSAWINVPVWKQIKNILSYANNYSIKTNISSVKG